MTFRLYQSIIYIYECLCYSMKLYTGSDCSFFVCFVCVEWFCLFSSGCSSVTDTSWRSGGLNVIVTGGCRRFRSKTRITSRNRRPFDRTAGRGLFSSTGLRLHETAVFGFGGCLGTGRCCQGHRRSENRRKWSKGQRIKMDTVYIYIPRPSKGH